MDDVGLWLTAEIWFIFSTGSRLENSSIRVRLIRIRFSGRVAFAIEIFQPGSGRKFPGRCCRPLLVVVPPAIFSWGLYRGWGLLGVAIFLLRMGRVLLSGVVHPEMIVVRFYGSGLRRPSDNRSPGPPAGSEDFFQHHHITQLNPVFNDGIRIKTQVKILLYRVFFKSGFFIQ